MEYNFHHHCTTDILSLFFLFLFFLNLSISFLRKSDKIIKVICDGINDRDRILLRPLHGGYFFQFISGVKLKRFKLIYRYRAL